MNLKSLLICLAASSLLIGCGPATIDTSSDAALEKSAQSVRASLPEDRRDEFDTAIRTLFFSNVDLGALFEGLADPVGAVGKIERDFKAQLHGLTGEEVIALGAKVAAQRAAQKREREAQAQAAERERQCREARFRLTAQEQRKLAVEAAAAEKARFEISDAAMVRKRGVSYFSELNLIAVNGTPHPVSAMDLTVTLASSGRTIPWRKEEVHVRPAGGIEPGESAQLARSLMDDWASIKTDDAAQLTVTVARLYGPDSEPLYKKTAFTANDEIELDRARSEVTRFCAE